MHLRRALLLFAIVLALAAVAASVSRPREDAGERTERSIPPTPTDRQEPPTVSGGPAVDAGLTELRFSGAEEQKRLPEGAATVLVEVAEAGQVEIAGLGLSAAADPLTPAVFEVFASQAGRFEISFTPADGNESRTAGTLVVGPSSR